MEPQFNLTQDFCGDIESFSNTTEYDDVEKEVTVFMNAVAMMEQIVPVVLAFYIGR